MGGKCIKDIKVVNYAHMGLNDNQGEAQTNANEKKRKPSDHQVNSNNAANSQRSSISGKVIHINTNLSPSKKQPSSSDVKKSLVSSKSGDKSEKMEQKENSKSSSGVSSKRSSENKINVNSNVEIKKENSVEEDTKGMKLRKNSKKNAIGNLISSNESQILQIVKSKNKEFEDAKLIDSCLTKHFFMRVLDKQSRLD